MGSVNYLWMTYFMAQYSTRFDVYTQNNESIKYRSITITIVYRINMNYSGYDK